MATKTNTTSNGYQYYRITRTIGHEYIDGKKKPIKKQFLGRSKREAEKKYDQWKDEQREKSQQIVASNKSFRDVVEFYRDNVFDVSTKYAAGTKDRYKRAYRQFCDADVTGLLEKPIQEVTAANIQLAYNSFDVHLSTVQALNKFFRLFFKWAVLNRYCFDVLSAVTIPNKEFAHREEKIVVWEDSELSAIDDALTGHRFRFMVILSLYCGLRIGEVLGIRYSDFDDNMLHVRRQYTREGIYKEPKYKSIRDIPLHDVVKEELLIHSSWHKAEMKRNKYKTDQVFTTTIGTPYDHANVRHRFEDLYRVNGIPCKKFHAYRATFCTNLCKAGVPIQIAASLMGHKSVDITSRFYTFVSENEKVSAIHRLSQL